MATLARSHVCQLCGVAFVIGRIRNCLEPYAAAIHTRWCGRYGGSWFEWAGGCGQNAGCMTAFHYERILTERERRGWSSIDRNRELFLQDADVPEPAKLVAGSLLPDFTPGHLPTEAPCSEYLRVVPGLGQTEKLLHIGDLGFWVANKMSEIFQRRLEEEGFIFGHSGGYGVFPEETFEHIAGPRCQAFGQRSGYSGQRITYDEMSMCCVTQALHCRGQPAIGRCKPLLVDDEDWERLPNTEWMLSGLATSPTSLHGPLRSVPRRLSTNVDPRNETSLDWPADRKIAMVFHPTCLEVFKRAAIQRYGVFDMNQLGRWFVATCNFTIQKFPRHPAVRRGVKDVWCHNIGDEWITADPCSVKGLNSLIQSFSTETVARSQKSSEMATLLEQDTSSDMDIDKGGHKTTLVSLSTELHLSICDELPIGAVANLTLALPVLTQTTCEYIYRRVIREWPFIWEFWSPRPYSKWTTKQPCELREMYKQYTGDGGRLYSPEVGLSGSTPGLPLETIFAKSGFVPRPALIIGRDCCTGLGFIRFVAVLDDHLQKGNLKGLQNRQRIWNDCELVLDQIEMLKRHTNGDWDVLTMQEQGRWHEKLADEFEALLYG